LLILFLPNIGIGQTLYNATSFNRFHDSLFATPNCDGSGYTYDNNLKNRFAKTGCAYHTKKLYDSLVVRVEREELNGHNANTTEGETYCEKIKKCISKVYQQKNPLIEKLWKKYEAGLEKAVGFMM